MQLPPCMEPKPVKYCDAIDRRATAGECILLLGCPGENSLELQYLDIHWLATYIKIVINFAYYNPLYNVCVLAGKIKYTYTST